jgi:drug/metabolite transporter (DMT)-like permease
MKYEINLIQWFWMAALSFLWATSFFFVKVALAELTPLDLTFLRVSFAAFMLFVCIMFTKEKIPKSVSVWRDFITMGILNNLVPFSLVAFAQLHITSGLAAILNALTPVFTVLLAHFLIKGESLTIRRSLGIIFGLLGVGVLVGLENIREISTQNIGQIAVLGAAFSYACAGIFGRRLHQYPAVISAFGMIFSTTIIMLPYVIFCDRSWQLYPSIKIGLSVICLAISTTMTYILYFKLLMQIGSSNLMLVTFLVPISALTLGILFLNEQLQWNQFVGMIFIFTGLIAIDGRLLSFKK